MGLGVNLIEDGVSVFDWNITHNLTHMADLAGCYKACWRPEDMGASKGKDLIKPLTDALVFLCTNPEQCKALNPSNGWGDYDGLVDFVKAYLVACSEHPDADIEVSR